MNQPAIVLRDVGVLRADRWILSGINWSVQAGACAAILGPNGSGKSTLTRVIAGQIWPSRGEAGVLGERFGEVDLHQLRRGLRLVQPGGVLAMDADATAQQVVMTGYFGTIGLYDPTTPAMSDESMRMLDLVGMRSLADHRFGTLSTGERMRCLIARALVVRPRLLMLDEPTNGLDLLAREQVLAAVQALTKLEPAEDRPTLLLITHHLEELPPAMSQVLLLGDGRVAASGTPEEVLRAEVLSPVYRCPLEVRVSEGRYWAHVSPGSWSELLRDRR